MIPTAASGFWRNCPPRFAPIPRRHSIHAGATFAWDSRFSRSYRDFGVNKGQGGIAHVIADPDIANRSREFAVTFFKTHLGAD